MYCKAWLQLLDFKFNLYIEFVYTITSYVVIDSCYLLEMDKDECLSI